jgi:predicted nucleotidyltransferase
MGILATNLSRLNLSASQFEEIATLVRNRIINISSPQRIYIFGSYARGTPMESSDLDLAIIFENQELLKKNKKILLTSKLFLDYSVDYLFYTADVFEMKAEIGGVCSVIKNEGKIIYDKRTKI